jgi:hypothetical protein
MTTYNDRLRIQISDLMSSVIAPKDFNWMIRTPDDMILVWRNGKQPVEFGRVADWSGWSLLYITDRISSLLYSGYMRDLVVEESRTKMDNNYTPEKISPKDAGFADGQLWNSFIGPDRIHDQSTVFMIGSNFAKQKGYTDVDSNNAYTFQFIKCFKVGQYSAPTIERTGDVQD